ncbi:MAG: hypothetical protein ACXWKP_09000 [Bradyrhizobium sp.]
MIVEADCFRSSSLPGLTRQSILLGMTGTRITVALMEAAMDSSQKWMGVERDKFFRLAA